MRLEKIQLRNFRSFAKAEFEFGQTVVVVGPNGSGKSNLLEAIFLLAVGKSFRAEREEEMVRYGEKFFKVVGTIGEMGEMGVSWVEGGKQFEINGVGKRMVDFVGSFRAVLFGPQDLELVTGSPSGRRRYLDFVLSQVDREYRRSLLSYERGLRQRNKLLESIREGRATRSQLFFWDRLLIKNGEYITTQRQEYLARQSGGEYQVEYEKSVISEGRLKQYEQEEVAAAATLVGPHRDNFIVTKAQRDLAKYGSRGEQRLAVLWLKKGELEYLSHFAFASRDAQPPLLLLDDIFSELDHDRRTEVMRLVGAEGQVIVTTADRHLIPGQPGDYQLLQL